MNKKFRENELWDELMASATAPLLGANEKTIAMIAEETKHSENTVRVWVKKWVREGKLRYVGKRQTDLRHSSDAWIVVTKTVV